MFKRKGKFIAVSIILFLLGAFGTYHFFINNKVTAEGEPVKNYRVQVSKEDFKKVEAIQAVFGYKREYDFSYEPFKDQNFLFEDNKDGNFIKNAANLVHKKISEKSLVFDVKSITMLGYDGQYLNPEDITYNPSTKTLYIKPPHLQMAVMIDYEQTELTEGWFTYMFDRFTQNEIDEFHDGARKKVQDKYLTTEEIEEGYRLTNKAFEKLMLNKEYSIDVKKVVFEKNEEPVEVINEELEK